MILLLIPTIALKSCCVTAQLWGLSVETDKNSPVESPRYGNNVQFGCKMDFVIDSQDSSVTQQAQAGITSSLKPQDSPWFSDRTHVSPLKTPIQLSPVSKHLGRGGGLHASCLGKWWRVGVLHWSSGEPRKIPVAAGAGRHCKQVTPAQPLAPLQVSPFQTTHPSSSSCLSWRSGVYFQNAAWDKCIHSRETSGSSITARVLRPRPGKGHFSIDWTC